MMPENEPEMGEMGGAESETISLAIVRDQKPEPGDEVRVRVLGVDEENGTVQVGPCYPKGKKPDAVGEMASEFESDDEDDEEETEY